MTITILSIILLLHVFFANLALHQKNKEIERLQNLLKEVEEVYRKAKAWQELKEENIKRYTGLRTLILKGYEDPSDVYYLAVFADELKQMDELDGTNEFSNLLNDTEDE